MYIDKRLAGIQAVQTLSRLNRAYRGPLGHKDTTYILDFVNAPDEVLAAFQPYYETAALAGVTDPNLVYDLRARLDAAGYYDEYVVDRVVALELDPRATQKQLAAAVAPVAERLHERYKEARAALTTAQARQDSAAEQAAQDGLKALVLFKRNLGTFLRVYSFLSQIFDYGNTAIEKRSIFFRHLLPLLDYGREREGVDLSKVELTHHALHDQGRRNLPLTGSDEGLAPMTDAGSGEVHEKEKARLREIIAAVNACSRAP